MYPPTNEELNERGCPLCDNTGLHCEYGYLRGEDGSRLSDHPQTYSWVCWCSNGERWLRQPEDGKRRGPVMYRLTQPEYKQALQRKNDKAKQGEADITAAETMTGD